MEQAFHIDRILRAEKFEKTLVFSQCLNYAGWYSPHKWHQQKAEAEQFATKVEFAFLSPPQQQSKV